MTTQGRAYAKSYINTNKIDPLEWKTQDHYAILGLENIRWEATQDQIKKAYRRKVLKHHPDKTSHKGPGNDSFFKCIQKAWEVLSDPESRKQYDAVDPNFDESIPSHPLPSDQDFFEVYGPAFFRNSRFSVKPNPPRLGDMNCTRKQVEEFYDFWLNFESWRTFEALDEEPVDNAESREEKRWLDRKNKAARAKRKKEDNQRLSKLVEQALKADPRIEKFREQEREAKLAKRREKEQAVLAAQQEKKEREEQEQKAREQAEWLEKEKRQQEKLVKEELKKKIKKEKKTLRRLFPSDDLDVVRKLEYLLDVYDLPELEKFRFACESSGDPLTTLDQYHQEKFDEKQAEKDQQEQTTVVVEQVKKKEVVWTAKEVAILIKAVKMFPGGTLDRWAKIAEYVNNHGGEDGESDQVKLDRWKSPEECIRTSKAVQRGNLMSTH